MMKPVSTILPCGKRLHLQHGPIDLIISANKNRHLAFEAAKNSFETVLEELVAELPSLRSKMSPMTTQPNGAIAMKMHLAARPFSSDQFVTRMAAVAGAVADSVLHAMKVASSFDKAYVNNGGDIALYLVGGEEFVTAISSHNGSDLGRISIKPNDNIQGIATSGRHGRSLSLGVADSVTVLAKTAAEADVAATLIANEVDIPNHPLILRESALSLAPDSDLGDRLVVTDCKPLNSKDQNIAIDRGEARALDFLDRGLIQAAAIFFQDEIRVIGSNNLKLKERTLQYA